MLPEEREAFDEAIVKMRVGRMKRRTFLERMLALGVSSTVAASLLEACGSSGPAASPGGGPVTVTWQSEVDRGDTYRTLVAEFNNTVGKQKGITLVWKVGPQDTGQMMTQYNNMFRARSDTLDIVSVDIVYVAQFGANQWTKEITTDQWPASDRTRYLAGPLQACTYQGKLWAAPYRTDLGLLYYRKDLVSAPPTTWEELTDKAASVSPSRVKYGHVWQGAQYEGLICDFVEVLHGYGGSVLDPNDPTKVTINSPQAQQALTTMVNWVGTISPPAVTTYKEDEARAVWQQGNSAFMRNWPFAYALGNDPASSQIVNKFDITAIPHGGSESVGHSAIGGWNLAINAFSKNPDAAWEFIKFMLSDSSQKKGATGASWTTTLQSVYTDSEVLQKQPLFSKLGPLLQNAKPRPVSPRYTNLSDALQAGIHKALVKQAPVPDTLKTLEADLKRIVSS